MTRKLTLLAAKKLAEGYINIKVESWNLNSVISRPGFRFLNFSYRNYNKTNNQQKQGITKQKNTSPKCVNNNNKRVLHNPIIQTEIKFIHFYVFLSSLYSMSTQLKEGL